MRYCVPPFCHQWCLAALGVTCRLGQSPMPSLLVSDVGTRFCLAPALPVRRLSTAGPVPVGLLVGRRPIGHTSAALCAIDFDAALAGLASPRWVLGVTLLLGEDAGVPTVLVCLAWWPPLSPVCGTAGFTSLGSCLRRRVFWRRLWFSSKGWCALLARGTLPILARTGSASKLCHRARLRFLRRSPSQQTSFVV